MKSFKEVLSESALDPDLKTIERELEAFFKKVHGVDVRKEDPKDWHRPRLLSVIGARHWGKWNVPDGEEDDGDYDWEELDVSSASLVKNLCKQIEAKHPKYELSFGTEEKNWLYVFVAKK